MPITTHMRFWAGEDQDQRFVGFVEDLVDNVWLDVEAIAFDGGEFFGPFKISFHVWTSLHGANSFEDLIGVNSCGVVVWCKLCVRRNIRNIN